MSLCVFVYCVASVTESCVLINVHSVYVQIPKVVKKFVIILYISKSRYTCIMYVLI